MDSTGARTTFTQAAKRFFTTLRAMLRPCARDPAVTRMILTFAAAFIENSLYGQMRDFLATIDSPFVSFGDQARMWSYDCLSYEVSDSVWHFRLARADRGRFYICERATRGECHCRACEK